MRDDVERTNARSSMAEIEEIASNRREGAGFSLYADVAVPIRNAGSRFEV